MVSTLAAALLAALGLSAGHAAQPSAPTFFVEGHGWGHGVGLAQYGAYGYALHGWSYSRIVAHYYPGTTLGEAPLKRVRVLLVGGAKRVTISSRSPFTVRDASNTVHRLPAGTQQLGPGLRLNAVSGAKTLPGPLVFAPGNDALALNGRAYRGSFRVTGGRAVRVVDVVGLEPYLWSVVPREMPDRWPAEALKAQAVVARSYALSHRQKGGDFDLYPDTRSQVYGGIAAESGPARDAVNATAGQVVLYRGVLANTFFYSSSGGRTANVQDVWASKPIPYLVSVPDPYDTLSPYHDWGPLRFSAGMLDRRLRAPGKLLDVRAETTPSGRVRWLTLIGSEGERNVPGATVRRALGLRSTWFTIGSLSLMPPTGPVVYGAQVRLVGLARGLRRVMLESRSYGGRWKPLAQLRSRGGRVAATLSPKMTTDYRISTAAYRSAAVRVSVAPSVSIAASLSRTELSGLVKPLLPGAAVQVLRQTGPSWTTVARTIVSTDGSYGAALALTAGTYRVRVVARKGYAVGLSKVLKVVDA